MPKTIVLYKPEDCNNCFGGTPFRDDPIWKKYDESYELCVNRFVNWISENKDAFDWHFAANVEVRMTEVQIKTLKNHVVVKVETEVRWVGTTETVETVTVDGKEFSRTVKATKPITEWKRGETQVADFLIVEHRFDVW